MPEAGGGGGRRLWGALGLDSGGGGGKRGHRWRWEAVSSSSSPDRGALIAIAEGAINVREDPILREHDVVEILKVHTILSRYPDFERWEVQGLPREYDIHPIAVYGNELHLMELALEEMRKYAPLKGHRKMQLMLEFVRDTKPHVLDTLSYLERCQIRGAI
ncbi:hypothetical protein RHGRI_012261 [Rhododendron griersonianum]|uniref:Uncharacterized protein n=1 Tax=Rhododendron griersonianum TaxID=479676 RepID=A0AAV6KPR5_9ERIC|nr:hypothetical protein RHGRI_012261 [Rhododendron griersonianum]